MMKTAWIGGFFLAAGLVACGDDSTGSGGGGGSTSTDASSSAGSPTSSSTSNGTPTSSTGSGPSGSGGDPSGSGGDPSGSGGDPSGSGGDPGSGGAPGTGGGGPLVVAAIIDCDGVTPDQEIGTVGLAYDPAEATIAVGGIVRFDPAGGFHDIDSSEGLWADTPTQVPTCLRFDVAGEYGTVCSVHSFVGTITVTE